MNLDSVLMKASLSQREMEAVKGGFKCYCGTTYKGEYTSTSECCKDCGITC